MLSTLEFPEMAKIFNFYFKNTLADRAILSSSLLIKQHFSTGKSVFSISWKTAYTLKNPESSKHNFKSLCQIKQNKFGGVLTLC
jgi:hypothetical protein